MLRDGRIDYSSQAQADEVHLRGHGVTRAAAAEDVWKRHTAPHPDSKMDVRALPTLGN
jgi:hypothetical protein